MRQTVRVYQVKYSSISDSALKGPFSQTASSRRSALSSTHTRHSAFVTTLSLPMTMAPPPSDDTLITVSGDVAQKLVDHYYRSIKNDQGSLPSFYISHADSSQIPTIIFNGNLSNDPLAYRDMLSELGPISHDIQCYDCQVINPEYTATDGATTRSAAEGRHATVAILVSGTIKIGPTREAEVRGFSESFVLAPNPTYTKDRRKKDAREWLIQSQCFRFVS
jgi:NTF2-related export protein 1/2